MLTALDQVANQNHLQLIKAVIPYIQPENQKVLSICIKIIELQNILHFFGDGSRCVSACSSTSEQPGIIEILTDIRNYCEEGEQEMIDQWIQIASTLELYSIYSQSPQDSMAENPMNSEENYE